MLINRKNHIPIYVQLREQIKYGIATGILNPGDRLPTVRQHARDLNININTVRKAYGELEIEGYVCTRQGKGTYVVAQPRREEPNISELLALQDLMDELLNHACGLGLSPDELADLFRDKLVRSVSHFALTKTEPVHNDE